jgi:phage terminase large subunit-like protein
MAATPTKTKSSIRSQSDTRRLSEVARHVVVPSGIVSTGWPMVYRRIREFGYVFDQWQQDLGALVLAKRADGEHAATVDGITLSIARQVAKTFFVSRVVFALCTLFPGLTVLWTAHRTRTSNETFRKLSALADQKRVAKYVEKVREANGEQEILFKNGSRILFGAREGGFGRGFDEVDIIIFDEAQILTEKAIEDMVAAANQSRWEPGALVFFMGTPPRPVDPGETFTNRREGALKFREGKEYGAPSVGEDGVYVECSADQDADPDDREQWKKGNPSYPLRTPLRSMLRLRKLLPSIDSWRREGLGIWDRVSFVAPTIVPKAWGLLAIPAEERPAGRLVVGVKFSVDGAYAGLSVATRPVLAGVPVHVSGLRVASTAEGLSWIVQWCVARKDKIAQIVIDGKGADQVLVKALTDAGFRPLARGQDHTKHFLRVPTFAEYVAAMETFLKAVEAENLTHSGDKTLADQVAGAVKKARGQAGGWGWSPLTDGGDVTLLDSACLAFWGATTVTRQIPGAQKQKVGY